MYENLAFQTGYEADFCPNYDKLKNGVRDHFIVISINWSKLEARQRLIEQKGMTFDHDFCYLILLFFFPSFFKREEKRGKNNQSRGQKSCLSA